MAVLALSVILPAFPVPNARAYVENTTRWRNDDGNETTATYAATENTPLTDVAKGSSERLRFGVANSNDVREFYTLANVGLTPSSDQSDIQASAIDPAQGYGYYVSTSITFAIGCHVLKVSLSNMAVVDDVALGAGPDTCDLATAVIDTSTENLYVGDGSTSVYRIDVNPSHSYAVTGTLPMTINSVSSVIDTSSSPHYAYFGDFSSDQVTKVDLSSFSVVNTIATGAGGDFRSAIIDPSAGFAYFDSFSSPAQIAKIDLTSFSVSSILSLDSGTVPGGTQVPGGYAFVIDTSGPTHYAYLNGFDAPSYVVKIDLNTFSVPVAPITGAIYPGTGVIDTTGSTHYAYFAESGCEPAKIGCTSNGVVVRVNLNTFVYNGVVGLLSNGKLSTMTLDPSNELIYIGSADDPAHLFKISLANATGGQIQYGLKTSTCAAISNWTNVGTSGGTQDWTMSNSANITNGDPTTDSSGLTNGASTFVPGEIHDTTSSASTLIRLKDDQFTELEYSITPTTHAPNGGDYCFRVAGSESYTYAEATLQGAHQDAYRWRNDDGTETTATYAQPEDTALAMPTATPVRLRMGLTGPFPSDIPLSEVGTATTFAAEGRANVAVADPGNGFIYYGTNDFPANVVKVRESDNTEVAVLPLDINNINSAVIDTVNGFAYFGSDDAPAQVAKVRLSDFTEDGSAITLSGDRARSAVIDPTNGFAYFGLFGSSGVGKVSKVDLSSFAEVATLSFPSGRNHPRTAAVDLTNHFAYFGTLGSSCGAGSCGTDTYVVKVNIDPATSTFQTQTATSVDLQHTGANNLRSSVIDTGNGYAYFGDQNGMITEIRLSDFTYFAHHQDSGFDYLSSAVIDTANGYAYFGSNSNSRAVYQIDLSSLAEANVLILNTGERFLYGAAIDTDTGYAFFGTQSFPGQSVKLQLAHPGGLRLEYGLNTSGCAAVSAWTQVGAPAGSQDWTMVDSPNLTDGQATTDSAGLSNPPGTFTASQAKDLASQTSPLALDGTHFTEAEYSLEANSGDTNGAQYCFRLTDAGDTTGFVYSHYAQATIGSGGGGGGGGPTNPTITNRVVESRLQTGQSSTANIYFTLPDVLDGTLTVTFPSDYTLTGAPTGGTCAGGGTIDTFAFNNTNKTFTAEKHGCTGDVALTGGTVINPVTPGPKLISWVNDDPGFAIVAITSDDQIYVSASVNAFIKFQVTTDHTGANANCSHGTDADSGDHTPSTDGGVVQLGLLDPTSVASSDAARNGAATDDGDSPASPVTPGANVQHICTFVSTNAGSGYSLSVKSENGALGSDGTPADTIPATPITGAPTAQTATPGAEHYVMCLSTANAPQMDATTPAGTNLTATAPYNSGTCTGVNTAQAGGELSTQASQIGSAAGSVQEGTAQWLVKTSITAATKAHNDYDDTLTFIATGTF